MDLPLPSSLSPNLTDRERDLLQRLVAANFSLHDFAQSSGLSCVELLDFANSPAVRAAFDTFLELAEVQRRLIAAQAEAVASRTLADIATTAADPIERRRAAIALVRLVRPPEHRPAPAEPTDPEPPRTPRPKARRLPSRTRRLEDVLPTVLEVLRTNDHPTPNSGLATLHAFFTPDARASIPNVDELIESIHRGDSPLAPLVNHAAATVSDPAYNGNRRARVLVTVDPAPIHGAPRDSTDPAAAPGAADHTESPPALGADPPSTPAVASFLFHLYRPDKGPDSDCWLIHAIEPTDSG